MLSHELVELVERLCVLRVVRRVLLGAGRTLLGMGGRRLAAVAAHKRGQNGGVVHAAVQPPEQRPHALAHGGRVPALAAAAIPVRAPPPDGKRLHLQLLPSPSPFPVHVLGGCQADGVLPAVAEATVLVLVVLQEVVDRPQPQRAARTQAPGRAVAVAVPATVAASPAAIRIDLFTPFAEMRREGIYNCLRYLFHLSVYPALT